MNLFVSKGNKYFDLKSGPEDGKNLIKIHLLDLAIILVLTKTIDTE